jgi:hypothetical protein
MNDMRLECCPHPLPFAPTRANPGAGPDFGKDVAEMPTHLQTTLDRREGFDEVAALLRRDSVRRIVLTGNRASFYMAQALWLTASGSAASKPVLSLPAGILFSGRI